jgi:hypothetical protein
VNAIVPKYPISIRTATEPDLSFIDSLQRMHSRNVGWMQTKALEAKIGQGQIIIAEQGARAIGYCMGQDRYFKRDDVGIIYQMNIEPGHQRSLVGASLLKAMFERSAYGCKLYCCWCAQDIAANKFWEAMGFVALAFRAGSEKKARVHIFWQRRIRAGDVTTPYWFPSQTNAGSIREDRIVLPIPPGTHWSDAKPMILPEESAPTLALLRGGRITGRGSGEKKPVVKTSGSVVMASSGALWFGTKKTAEAAEAKVEKVKEPKKKKKNNPKLVSAARELRDRWLEKVNAGEALLEGAGKYEVSRVLTAAGEGMKQLAA